MIPTNVMTRIAHLVANAPLPRWTRSWTIGAYARAFACNLGEAEKDLADYGSLGAFFSRRLKAGLRKVDAKALLVSPADGVLLHCGVIEKLPAELSSPLVYPEQVKGVRYAIRDLLPQSTHVDSMIAAVEQGNQSIYYATVYLSPGDYHRFHSPCDWQIAKSEGIRGELLPVAPWMMRWLPGLVALNQRHALMGFWRPVNQKRSWLSTQQADPAFFAMVPVGATNVGSIIVDKDAGEKCRAGEEIGHFAMGSSIVLLFSGPSGMQWKVRPGERVLVGQALIDPQSSSAGWFSLSF